MMLRLKSTQEITSVKMASEPMQTAIEALGSRLDSQPGTYALILGLRDAAELRIGCIGRIHFDSPFYLYFGSAFGPGGLRARVRQHLNPLHRAHWHIDYLRQAAQVLDVWYTTSTTRLECTWANAALAIRDTSQIRKFGSSDCRCRSHLLAVKNRPRLHIFQSRFNEIQPDSVRIRRIRVTGTPCWRDPITSDRTCWR